MENKNNETNGIKEELDLLERITNLIEIFEEKSDEESSEANG